MGKHLWSKNNDDEIEDDHPGCMWGIIHALDYHHWNHNVRKMLLHKRHYGRRHSKCIANGNPRTRYNAGEVQTVLDDEASHVFVNHRSKKTTSTNKNSLKARIKAFITEKMAQEEDGVQQRLHLPTRACFERTYSIHHLEPLDSGPEENSGSRHPNISRDTNSYRSPTRLLDSAQTKATDLPVCCNESLEVRGTFNVANDLEHNFADHTFFREGCDKTRELLANQKLMEANQLGENVLNSEFKDHLDVLEIFKVNKELFLKILQNSDNGITNSLHSLQDSNKQARFTKSVSFPSANFPRIRNSKPSRLERKLNEIWSSPKGYKSVAGTQAPNFVASKVLKDLNTETGALMADDCCRGSDLNQERSISSLSSTHELDEQGSNDAVVDLSKHIKQRSFTSLDTIFEVLPNGCSLSSGGTETNERARGDGKDSPSSCETDGSVHDVSKRTSSLNESLNRYNQLFESGFSREVKWNRSKSLKLTNEDEIPSSSAAPISFRRIHSLPRSYCFSQNEVSRDSHLSGMPSRPVVERSGSHDELKPQGLSMTKENHVPVYGNEETECPNITVTRSDNCPGMERLVSIIEGIDDEGTAEMDVFSEEMDRLPIEESNPPKELTFAENASNKLPQPSPFPVLESCFRPEETVPAEFSTSEGLESRCESFDENESTANSQDRSGTDSLSCSSRATNPESFENINISIKSHRNNQVCTEDDIDFNYVKAILEQSGFTGEGYLGKWHTPDLPLNPSLFVKLEDCLPDEPECTEEAILAFYHRELLFDLVNEVLIQIFNKSFSYYPSALSFSCHIRPMPLATCVFDDVWTTISRTLRLRLELEQPLDFFVAQDLANGDNWMNLQSETECAALELEELIFDELLEEIMCS